MSDADFATAFGKKVFAYLLSEETESDNNANINEVFSPDEVSRITKMKVARMMLEDNGQAVFVGCVRALKDAVATHLSKEEKASYSALDQLLARKAQTED